MAMTVGRCAVLDEPQSITLSGDVLQFKARINVTTLAGYQAAVGQLRGLVDNRDENAFPITCASDPSLDGFYTDFSVDVEPNNGAGGYYTLPFASVRCRRVGASALPRIEVVAQSFVRTNSHALSPASAFLTAIPSAIAGIPLDTDIFSIFTGTPIAPGITPETGVITQYTAAPQATIKSGRYSLSQTPADRYDGSAVIEQSYDNGSTWTRIVGNQVVYPYIGGSSSFQRWRIGNGLIRIVPYQGGAVHSHRVSTFNGATWEDTDIMFLDGVSDLDFNTGVPIIVQNSPLKCTISVTFGDVVIMFTVTRGIRLVTVTFASSGTTYKWGARSASADAATAITGGLRRTNNDANGNRWVILVPATATSDLVNGYHYYTTATTTGTVGIGIEHNGTTATGQDVATAIRDAFYLPALVDERVTIR